MVRRQLAFSIFGLLVNFPTFPIADLFGVLRAFAFLLGEVSAIGDAFDLGLFTSRLKATLAPERAAKPLQLQIGEKVGGAA